jgi:hypothetical protein
MAALIDADGLRERFDIDDADSFPDGRITPHIASASARLRQWVGDTNYDGALETKADLAETPAEEVVDADQARFDVLRNAEAHLTMHYAIVGFQYPLSHKGILSTSMADEGKEIRKYLSPDDTAKVAGQLLEWANLIAKPYLQSSDQPALPSILAAADDTGCEAATRPC